MNFNQSFEKVTFNRKDKTAVVEFVAKGPDGGEYVYERSIIGGEDDKGDRTT